METNYFSAFCNFISICMDEVTKNNILILYNQWMSYLVPKTSSDFLKKILKIVLMINVLPHYVGYKYTDETFSSSVFSRPTRTWSQSTCDVKLSGLVERALQTEPIQKMAYCCFLLLMFRFCCCCCFCIVDVVYVFIVVFFFFFFFNLLR